MTELPRALSLSIAIPAMLFAAFYVYRAARESRFLMLATLGAILYTVYIELTNVADTRDYFYAEMPLMLGDSPGWVPLSICASWASIFFVTTRTADLLGMPWSQRPLFAGLLAVLLDFVGDPIMSARCVDPVGRACFGHTNAVTDGGVGLWVWTTPPEAATWMNVPLGNYVGWILVIAVLSFAITLADRHLRVSQRGLLAQLLILTPAIALAAVLVVQILRLYDWLAGVGISEWLMLVLLVATPLVLLFRERQRLTLNNPVSKSLLILPALSYLTPWYYFFSMNIHDRTPPVEIAAMGALTATGGFLFLLPYLQRLTGTGALRTPR